MKIISILFACLVLGACRNSTEQSTTTSTDTQAAVSASTRAAETAVATGRAASDGMMNDMRSMMADMKGMSMSGDPDHDFAMMMKRHHEGGIAMAERELQTGADAELKQMAEKMKADQQKESADLQGFLDSHKPGAKSPFGENAMKMMEASAMITLPMKGDPDQDFAALMTQHHKDALDMSNEYLKTGKEAKIKGMAQKMIQMQKEEMGKLADWTGRHASKG